VNVNIDNLAPCKKLMRIEIDSSEVDSNFESVIKEFIRHAKIPGFRKGKAPKVKILQHYAEDIDSEVKRRLIPKAYQEAVKENKLDIIGHPDIEEIQFGRGQALEFAATIEIAPQFELPEYVGLEITKEKLDVTEDDMQRAFDILREKKTGYTDVDREAQREDFLVVNYQGFCEDKPITDFSPTYKGLTEQKNFWLEIKENSFIPGFTEQLIGMKKGDKRTVEVDFPSSFVAPKIQDKKGRYEVELLQVKEKTLPELNDEFAKTFGVESIEALRQGLKENLAQEQQNAQERDVRNQVIKVLMDQVKCELPESIVKQQTKSTVYDIVRENQNRGMSNEDIEKHKDAIYDAASTSARERIKVVFVLGEIAEKEKIQPAPEEVNHEIQHMAEHYKIKPKQMIKKLKDQNAISEVYERIVSRKVVEFLLSKAKITEIDRPKIPSTV